MEAGRPEAKRGFGRGMLIVGILGLATSFPALMGKPEMFYRSYLLAFVFWNGLAVGSLAVLMLQYLTGGAWGIAIRRPLEAAARTRKNGALRYTAFFWRSSSFATTSACDHS